MNRVSFISSIDGIAYPRMIVDFFDHFLALKQIIEDTGEKINISSKTDRSISFEIDFNNNLSLINAMHTISCLINGVINIYNRPISVFPEVLTDKKLRITLS
jgi:hypothetical protein